MNVVNVVGVIRGTRYPDRYVIMSADIDSRASNGTDGEVDGPSRQLARYVHRVVDAYFTNL